MRSRMPSAVSLLMVERNVSPDSPKRAPSSRLRKRIRPSRSHPCRILIASTLFTETLLSPYRQLYPCGLNINHSPRKYHSIKPNTIAPAGNRRALRITSPRPRKRKKAPSETEGALPTAPIVPHADHAEYRARGNRYPERYSPRRPLLRQLSPQGSCRL